MDIEKKRRESMPVLRWKYFDDYDDWWVCPDDKTDIQWAFIDNDEETIQQFLEKASKSIVSRETVI